MNNETEHPIENKPTKNPSKAYCCEPLGLINTHLPYLQ